MKKLDSKQHKETPEEELKRLRKRVKQLEGKEVKNTNTIKGLRKELKKKRRSENNYDQRTNSITLAPVPGHRFPLVGIQLCVLIYYRALVQKLGDRTNQNSQTSELILEHRQRWLSECIYREQEREEGGKEGRALPAS